MRDRLELRGEWWLPDSKPRWPGTLIYEPEHGVRLELTIARHHEFHPPLEAFPLVHGETVTGEEVTLAHAMTTTSLVRIPGGIEATLRPWRTFIGTWFEPREEIAFRRLIFQVEGLDEWVNRDVFTVKSLPGEYSVHYDQPAAVPVASVGDVQVEVSFSPSRQEHGTPWTRLDLGHEARLELLADEPVPYTRLDQLLRRVRNFFMFVTRERVGLMSVAGGGEDERTHRYREVQILYRPDSVAEPRRYPPEPRRMLFTFAKNGEDAESRLSRWLELHDKLEVVFNLYLVGLYQPRIFLEFRFLSLAQAAESLHSRSRRFNQYALPVEDHRKRVDAVVDAAPTHLREWARVRLRDANRKSYRDVLMELIAALPPVIRDAIDDPETFGEKVRETRNFLTHWSRHLEAKAARGNELTGLTWVLRAILEALLLGELGFTDGETSELLQRNEDYKRDLNFGLIHSKKRDAEDNADTP